MICWATIFGPLSFFGAISFLSWAFAAATLPRSNAVPSQPVSAIGQRIGFFIDAFLRGSVGNIRRPTNCNRRARPVEPRRFLHLAGVSGVFEETSRCGHVPNRFGRLTGC